MACANSLGQLPTKQHPMASPHSPGASFFDLARAVSRHQKLAVGVFAASVLVTLMAMWLWPRNYRSESKLYIRLGRESASLDPTAMIGRPAQGQSLPAGRENEINSVTEILLSRVLLEQVVDAVGPEAILDGTDPVVPSVGQILNAAPVPADSGASGARRTASLAPEADWPRSLNDRDQAIIKLQKMIDVQAVKKSDVVRVTCEGRSPLLAKAIVGRLVDLYLAEHLRLNRTSGAQEFLERQTAQMRETLTSTEEELRTLKDQTGFSSPAVQRELIVARAGRLEDELFTAAAELASAEAEVRLLSEKLAGRSKTTTTALTVGIPNHGVELMRKDLYALQMAEQELSSKFTDAHFAVHQARERSAEAKKVLQAEEESHDQLTSGPDVVYDQIQLALVKQEPLLLSLRAKADVLRSQIAEVRESTKKFNADELRIARLTRDLERQETNYEAYAQHVEQTRIDQALEAGRISSINIIQPATFEPKPSSPRLLVILCLGLLIGLIGAVGVPLAVDSLDLPLKHSQDIDNLLGVPLLASIPRFSAEQLSGNGKNS